MRQAGTDHGRRHLADLTWDWDETLYAGSAEHYARGRLPYPRALADALRVALGLDGTGRLVDIGCGPGSLTFLLAPLFTEAVGVDADAAMLAEAQKRAVANVRFVHLRAEQLPADLGSFHVATFAQSFHWMDQTRVAASVHRMLEPGGSLVHIGATTHEGDGDVPRTEIKALVESYLGPVRRAGQGFLPDGTRWDEEDTVSAVGFAGPQRVDVDWAEVFERTADDVVASVFSQSSAAPHLFGERLDEFETELRGLLQRASSGGRFSETTRGVRIRIWTR